MIGKSLGQYEITALLGVGGIREAAAPYANPVIFLFLGGFLLAEGLKRWGLHRRVALRIVRAVGGEPRRTVAGQAGRWLMA